MSDEEATEAKEESSKTTEVTESGEESEGGLGPALLVGLVILAVVGALVFWPSGDGPSGGKDGAKGGKAAAAAQGRAGKADGKGGASAKGPGGIARRDADDPARAGGEEGQIEAKYKMNPAIKLPQGIGLAPGVPKDEPPPKFETTEEEITWYEQKLVRAETHLEMRRKATERLERWRKKAEESDDQTKLAQYDKRAEVVNENYKRAQKKVKDIEAKIAELRGE